MMSEFPSTISYTKVKYYCMRNTTIKYYCIYIKYNNISNTIVYEMVDGNSDNITIIRLLVSSYVIKLEVGKIFRKLCLVDIQGALQRFCELCRIDLYLFQKNTKLQSP